VEFVVLSVVVVKFTVAFFIFSVFVFLSSAASEHNNVPLIYRKRKMQNKFTSVSLHIFQFKLKHPEYIINYSAKYTKLEPIA